MGLVQKYIKIPADIATENYGSINGVDSFNYGLTIHGEFFVDANTINTHPEIIDAIGKIEYIEVDYDDIIMYDENGEIITKNYKKPSYGRIPVITSPKPEVVDNEDRRFVPMNRPNIFVRLWRLFKRFISKIFNKPKT